MVEAIGAKPINGRDLGVTRIAAATPATAAKPTTTAASDTGADVASLAGVAKTLSASAPVDTGRVAVVKKAIAEGSFPILPATIADRLIALKLQWNANEAA